MVRSVSAAGASRSRSPLAWLACIALLAIGLVSYVPSALASHFAYGTISWQLTPTTANPTLYAVNFEAAFRRNYITFKPYNPTVGVAFTSSDIGTLTVQNNDASWTQTLAFSFIVQVVYTDNWMTAQTVALTFTAPSLTQLYTLIYTMCCRITTLVYSGGSYARITAQIGMGHQYSPRSTAFPRLYLVLGSASSFTVPSVHPAGWAMTYSISTTSDSSLTAAYPATPDYGSAFTLDASSGVVSWTPSVLGLYSIQFKISSQDPSTSATGVDFVMLDVIFQVLTACTIATSTCSHAPVFDPEVTTQTFYKGSAGTFTVTVRSDDGASQSLQIETTPLPSNSAFTYTSTSNGYNSAGNAATWTTYTFTWAPTVASVPATVCFTGYAVSTGLSSTGSHCTNLVFGSGDTMLVSGVLRDFHSSASYPTYLTDFAHADGDIGLQYVNTALGSNDLPSFNSAAGATTTNAANFAWWFTTDSTSAINEPQVYDIFLNNATTGKSNVYLWNPGTSWWPLDNQLFGNEADSNNRYFTLEIHTYITYTGGEILTFESSDDLFVFINDELPSSWTMGGIISSQVRSYTLALDDFFDVSTDTQKTYPVDIFYAHRSATGSPYIQLELLSATLCNSLDSGTTLISISDFSTASTSLALVGSSSIVSNKLQLISSGASLSSAVWFSSTSNGVASTYKIAHGFSATFSFQWSGITEGFAFVMQFDNGAAQGGAGSQLGYGGLAGIKNSIAIEFDGVTTASLGDPAWQHISIHSRYASANDASETYRVSGSVDSAQALNLALNNGTIYNATIEYVPAVDDGSTGPQYGWLRVYLGQPGGPQQVGPVTSAQLDGTVLESMWNGAAYVGFTAATSDSAYANINIYNFSLIVVPPSAAKSTASSLPTTISAGQTGSMVIQLRDTCGNTITTGDDWSSITATVSRNGVVVQTLSHAAGTIVDNSDGTYTLYYSPTTASTSTSLYSIAVAYGGIALSASPYQFAVTPGATTAAKSNFVVSYNYVVASASNNPAAGSLGVGSVGTVYITAYDTYGNLQTVNTDNFVVTFDPDLATGGGQLVQATKTGSGVYNATFATPVASTFAMYVRLDSTNLPNSPKSVTFVAGSADATQSTASGTGLTSSTAGVTGTFTLRLRDSGGNSITSQNTNDVTCLLASNGCMLVPVTTAPVGYTSGLTTGLPTPVNVSITCAWGSNTYLTCTYQTNIAYTYTVLVKINGVAMSSLSSAQVVISTGAISAPNCIASIPTGLVAGVSSTLRLQVRDLYSNNVAFTTTFTVTFTSTTDSFTATAAQLIYTSYGLYTLAFVPKVAGTNSYSVAISISSTAIASSPFALSVTPGSPDQLSIISPLYPIATVTTVPTTAYPYNNFSIQSRDAYSNIRTQGGAGSAYLVTLTNSATSQVLDYTGTVGTTTTALYPVQWYTTIAATYSLKVQVRTQSSAIVGGTVTVVVNPGVTATSMCVASGSGITGGVQGNSATVNVVAADIYGNTQLASVLDSFRIIVSGTTTNLTQVSDSTGVYYTGSYTVPTDTIYTTTVQRLSNGVWTDLPSSPFTCYSVSGTATLYVTLEGPNSAQAQMSALNTFYVIERTVDGVVLPGGTFLSVVISSVDSTGTLPTITIPNVAVSTGTASTYNFSVSFTPKFKFPNGNPNFLVAVSRGSLAAEAGSTGTGITASPYALTLVAGDVYGSACTLAGLPATSAVGTTGSFSVILRDRYGNPIDSVDTTKLKAVLTPATVTVPVTPTITIVPTASGSGNFTFTYDITVTATYDVVITYTDSTGTSTSVGSASTISQVTIVPDVPSAANSAVQPSAAITLPSTGVLFSSIVAGSSNSFVVIVRDRYNNSIDPTLLPSGSIDSYLTFAINDGGSGDTVATFTGLQYTGVAGVFEVYLRSYVSNPTTTGMWSLTVSVSGTAIPAVQVHVTSAAIDTSASSVDLPTSTVVAGTMLRFQLHVVDIYGNLWNSGVVTATATNVLGTSYSTTVATISVGLYNVTLVATATTKSGAYTFVIRAGGAQILNDQVISVTVVAGAVDASQTDVPAYLNSARAGLETTMTLGLRDKYANLISSPSAATLASINATFPLYTGESPCEADGDTVYYATTFVNFTVTAINGTTTLSFVGTGIGTFLVNVLIGGQTLSCTSLQRLTLTVTPGLASAENSKVTGLVNVTAGQATTLTVTLYDEYSNQLTSGGDSVLIGYAYRDAVPWSSAITNTPSLWLKNVSKVVDNNNGVYNVKVTPTMASSLQAVVTVNGYLIKTYASSGAVMTPISVVTPNVPNSWTLVDLPSSFIAAMPFVLTLQVTDVYSNAINVNTSSYSYSYVISGQTVSPSDYTFSGALSVASTGNYQWTATSALSGAAVIYISLQQGTSSLCSSSTPYRCSDFTCQSSSNACPNAAAGKGSKQITILGATCASVDASLPYRCPDVDSRVCVANYTQCPSLQTTLCPFAKPVRCASDNSCVASAELCPCPTGQSKCSTGVCVDDVSTQCHATPACSTSQTTCQSGSVVTCRANSASCPSPRVCTPGYVACADGITCRSNATDCPSLQSPATCPSGSFRCPSGRCTTNANDCPTPKTCTNGQVLCLSDGSCADNYFSCPDQYKCYAPTPFMCADGSCRTSAAGCPSAQTCAAGWVQCENGQCAQSLSSCLAPTKCPLSQVRCPLGKCAANRMLCPSRPTCPQKSSTFTPVLCSDRSCQSAVDYCVYPRVCSSSSTVCPDGSCISSTGTCPTTITCPSSTPILCSDGVTCTADLSTCVAPSACSSTTPMRCPDGSCRGALADCPSRSACPTSQPVRCGDGSCVYSPQQCVDIQSCASSTPYRCPGGECVASLSLCPTHVTCPTSATLCSDGSCRGNCSSVSPVACASGLLSCPLPSVGTLCVTSLDQCPLSFICPVATPVRCLDSSCAASISACPSLPSAVPESAKAPCPDGSWTTDITTCNTPASCPSSMPYKCWDETCRAVPTDCPAPPTCSSTSTPYRCPNGVCAASPYSTACTVTIGSVTCSEDAPVKCPSSYDCVSDVSECGSALTAGEQPNLDDTSTWASACPPQWAQCRDGSCRMSNTSCDATTCPQALPYLCASGVCAKNLAACPDAYGCYSPTFIGCATTGECVRSASECPARTSSCNATCPNGLCVSSDDLSIYSSICKTQLCSVRCADGTCGIAANISGTITASTPNNLCTQGGTRDPINFPIGNVCPAMLPYKCSNGLCAFSSLNCTVTVDYGNCPSTLPIQCANADCVRDSSQCPPLFPCQDDEMRCGDGTCRERQSTDTGTVCAAWGIINTCPYLGGTRRYRCDNGLCALGTTIDTCISLETGCPNGLTTKCSNGACIAVADSQNATEMCASSDLNPTQSNGCASGLSKCSYGGQCVADTTTDCPLPNGCLPATPFRCAAGSCVADTSTCPTPLANCKQCADGSCAPGNLLANCTALNGCPVLKPYRCANGQCAQFGTSALLQGATLSQVCAPTLVCADSTVMCYDGSCAATSSLCPAAIACVYPQVLCSDRTCAVPSQCVGGPANASTASTSTLTGSTALSICPLTVPILCDNGQCVSNVASCASSGSPGSGTGTGSGSQLLQLNVQVTTVSAVAVVASANTGTVSLPTSTGICSTDAKPIECFDGSCVESYAACVTLATELRGGDCPTGQWMCPTGECVLDPNGNQTGILSCGVIPSCGIGSLRCPDGSCTNSTTACATVDACPTTATLPTFVNYTAVQMQRCQDGVCRYVCPAYDGCPHGDTPYQCSNRECAANADSCSGAADGSAWDFASVKSELIPPLVRSTPARRLLQAIGFLAPASSAASPAARRLTATTDGSTSSETWCYADCAAQLKASSYTTMVDITQNQNLVIATDANHVQYASLSIPAGSMTVNSTATRVSITIAAVSDSVVRAAENRVASSRADIAPTGFLTFVETVLTPMFQIDVDESVTINTNFTVTATMDMTLTDVVYSDICLAKLYQLTSIGYSAWRCLYTCTETVDDEVQYVRCSVRDSTSTGASSQLTGSIGESGIYAFVEVPVAETVEPSGLSWIASNALWIFLVLAGVLVIVFFVLYVSQRLWRYRAKYKAEQQEVLKQLEEVQDMDQFGGQAGVKDDEIVMMANPLVVQMKDMQARLDEKQLALREEEARQKQEATVVRHEHITALAEDRDRLAAELDRLKAEVHLMNESHNSSRPQAVQMAMPVASARDTALRSPSARSEGETEFTSIAGASSTGGPSPSGGDIIQPAPHVRAEFQAVRPKRRGRQG